MSFSLKLSENSLESKVCKKTSIYKCFLKNPVYWHNVRSVWVNMLSLLNISAEIKLEFYILVLPKGLRFQVHHLSLQTTEALVQPNQSANCNAFDVVVSLKGRHSLNKISPWGSYLVFSERPNKSQRKILQLQT